MEKLQNSFQISVEKKPTSPISHEEMVRRRKLFIEEHDYISVNEIISYKINTDTHESLDIHLAPATDFGPKEKKAFILNGFKEIAKVVCDNPEIRKVFAVSWIVARHEKSLEKLGFDIVKSLDVKIILETKRLIRGSTGKDTKPVGMAVVSREKFLKLYLQK